MTTTLTANPEPTRAIVDRTEARVAELLRNDQLQLPPGYAWQNALRGAWLHLQQLTVQRGPDKGKPILSVVTQASVANALLDMVVQGLSVHQRQGYFIPYQQTLQFQRSYFGTVTVGRRVLGLQHADPQVVYEGDTFRFHIDRGRYQVDEHTSSLGNMMTARIIAAYVILTFDDPTLDRADIMTWDDLQASWGQSRTSKFDDSPHRTFAAEMAKRTVINRALKLLVNSATDDHLLLAAWNREGATDDALQAADDAEAANTLPLPVDVDDGGDTVQDGPVTIDAEPAPVPVPIDPPRFQADVDPDAPWTAADEREALAIADAAEGDLRGSMFDEPGF